MATLAPDRIHFLAKDPHWTWIGWTLSPASRERAAREAGLDPGRAVLTLRVHDLSSAGARSAPSFFDVEVAGDTDHWYLRLDTGGPVFFVRAGFKAADGRFVALAESPPLRLPPERPSEREGDEWREALPVRQAGGGEEKGYLLIVLNSHLPFVRHPEVERAAEEDWFFEAVYESYVPLVQRFSRLLDEAVPFQLTISLSPTLLEMLQDPLLESRCLRYGEERGLLNGREARRWAGSLVPELRRLADAGRVELLASCASHAYLPLWESRPEVVDLQVKLGVAHYRSVWGREPMGFWLPECGYSPGVDEVLAAAGLRFCFLDAHGLLNASPRPRFGVHAPVLSHAGVAAFGRDWHCHDLVWRKEVGYPGDPVYFDPHRGGYDPEAAFRRCDAHADHFVATCRQQVEALRLPLGRKPVLVALFDTEHFGHWWREGPQWLDLVIRKLAFDQSTVRLLGATDYLERQPSLQVVTPAASSWGYQGYGEAWLMGRNHWIYPLLFDALDNLRDVASGGWETTAGALPLLDQSIRELLLAQSSDWAFLLRAQTCEAYAAGRVRGHVERLQRLIGTLRSGNLDESWLAAVCGRDNLFAALPLWETYREILKARRLDLVPS
ncbi:MAG TPA: 1,4-alpha-glucan branching protein domain-containing protein [Thermoanaerobaculia bacterium]|nr:1,4-alpha-glucan branching protein domain-containing protein [Thermoanaerobaculia bacterium]